MICIFVRNLIEMFIQRFEEINFEGRDKLNSIRNCGF